MSDLHGSLRRYEKLFEILIADPPRFVFLGGDILPSHGFISERKFDDFISDFLQENLKRIRHTLKERYPDIFLILGNDDPQVEEEEILDLERQGYWTYIHNRKIRIAKHSIYGYAFVPPTPFHLKDWEKYDVSRHVDPGCVDPLEGKHSVPVSESEIKYGTIQKDLDLLVGKEDLSGSIFLFHTPPYRSNLDRAALDGKMIDHVALDVNIGSIAVRKFIEGRQPLLTLHGHVHESARITGSWRDRIGRTHLFSAAHDGPELALVKFDLENLDNATRELW